MKPVKPLVALAILGSVIGFVGPASATWSIVAVEPDSGRVGAALASCVPAGLLGEPDEPLVPVVLIPGSGVAITQGNINPDSPIALRQLLTDGFTPQDAVGELLAVDEQPTARQFGIAMLSEDRGDSSTTFTGEDVETARASLIADNVAVQGQLLADERVVDEALAAFQEARSTGQSLEQALVRALAAGSALGGDRRCDDSQTALFAHVAVAEPGDDAATPAVLLTVTVDEGDGQNPVPLLVEALGSGRTGWVDAGMNDPVGIPRVAVGVVGLLLAVAAFVVIRKGLGSPAARR